MLHVIPHLLRAGSIEYYRFKKLVLVSWIDNARPTPLIILAFLKTNEYLINALWAGVRVNCAIGLLHRCWFIRATTDIERHRSRKLLPVQVAKDFIRRSLKVFGKLEAACHHPLKRILIVEPDGVLKAYQEQIPIGGCSGERGRNIRGSRNTGALKPEWHFHFA